MRHHLRCKKVWYKVAGSWSMTNHPPDGRCARDLRLNGARNWQRTWRTPDREIHRAWRILIGLVIGALSIAADPGCAFGSGMYLLHAGTIARWAVSAGVNIMALRVGGSFVTVVRVFEVLCAILSVHSVVLFVVKILWDGSDPDEFRHGRGNARPGLWCNGRAQRVPSSSRPTPTITSSLAPMARAHQIVPN